MLCGTRRIDDVASEPATCTEHHHPQDLRSVANSGNRSFDPPAILDPDVAAIGPAQPMERIEERNSRAVGHDVGLRCHKRKRTTTNAISDKQKSKRCLRCIKPQRNRWLRAKPCTCDQGDNSTVAFERPRVP